jgi:hypothetical protein
VIPAAAALVVALALGEAKGTARAESRSLDASNAVRARAGLLPRKAPAKAGPIHGGVRVRPLPGLAPTYLGEPGTLADAPTSAPPPESPQRLAMSARGVTTDVTISMRFDAE